MECSSELFKCRDILKLMDLFKVPDSKSLGWNYNSEIQIPLVSIDSKPNKYLARSSTFGITLTK